AATTSRREKGAILARYLAGLDHAALAVAARFFGGTIFPRHDARTVQVGPALLSQALASVAGVDPSSLGERWVVHGDAGDLAADLLSGRADAGLALEDVAARLDALGAARSTAERRAGLEALLGALGAREARYLVRLLLAELRIGLREAQVEEALAAAYARPLDTVRRAHLLRGDIGEVAQLARAGTLETARLALFHPLGLMLAQPLPTAEEVTRRLRAPFVLEDKYDGIRAQAHIAGGRVVLFSRTLDDITTGYPEVVDACATLGEGLVLDGELLAMDPAAPARALPFKALQQRLGRKQPDAAVRAAVPVSFIAFDVLASDGVLVVDEPWSERHRILEQLRWPPRGALLAPWRLVSDASVVLEAFEAARGAGNEGLVAKDPASAYAPGRRGGAWFKLKQPLATLDVVVTAVERGHGRRRGVLSDYTFAVRAAADDPRLLVVGKAYSGLTDAEIAALTTRFETLTVERRGGWHRVRPEVVLEVTFDVVQPSGRHSSGYALRFPRIVRVRDDKPVEEIDTLARVRELAGA
ncbi:MAG TPA: ATP-dependent DNA ligase, partial [Candidatus Binatia bacterium]|nr:ATP-dependent DNA ligase [Candidatus Binatia bacterium]